MDELFEIYKQIEYLRNRGVKMKEIADYTNLAPSVLSSLYSNVLPTFANTVRKGTPKEEALDYALSQVNNVSKKKLMGNIQELKTRLFELEPSLNHSNKENQFIEMLNEEMQHSAQEIYNYSGI